MLAPDYRVVLLDQLRAPAGYQLDAAVGTTFTLDLPSALVPPLAFASFTVRSTTDPISLLEAVRSSADRVDVFVQTGMVRVPKTYSALFAFLEPMIHDVKAPPGGLFHPKIWLLRYTSEGLPDTYRLLCLSRNLTDDHAWDVALRLDATRGRRPQASNRALAALIRSLPDTLARPMNATRRARVLQLAEDARHLEWERPEGATDLTVHVFGVNGVRAEPDFSGSRHLVVSPFLNDSGLARLTMGSREAVVVSTPESLDGLRPDTVTSLASTYVVSTIAGLDDGDTEEGGPPGPLLSGLHAKMVVVERGNQAHVFVGSLNATDAALDRNVEVMVELTGGRKALGIGTMLDAESPFLAMLEQYPTGGGTAPDPDAERRWMLENALRVLAGHSWAVTVRGPSSSYSLRVDTSEQASVPAGVTAQAELLAHPGAAVGVENGAVHHGEIDGVPLLEVSPFLVLRLRDARGLEASGVVRAELRNDPAGRLDEVLAAQIDTPEKFLHYLALLLGLGQAHPLAALTGTGAGAGSGASLAPAPQLFEVVVRALAHAPESIDDLGRLVHRLQATVAGAAVLPEGFDALLDVVTASRARLTDRSTQ